MTEKKTKKTLKEMMSERPVSLRHDQTASDAATQMREAHVGGVLVTRDGKLCGIVTDRDLVVRCLADGVDPKSVHLGELCSKELVTLSPDSEVDEAISMMRDKAVRRVPVVEGEKPVGIVSIGDLALAVDRDSALAEISAAPPNR